MTSRTLPALTLAVLAVTGVATAALLDQQATAPVVPVSQTPAVPPAPLVAPVAPTPPVAPAPLLAAPVPADSLVGDDPDFDVDFDVDFDFDLDAVLADVESAVEQSVDGDAIEKQVEAAMQGMQFSALLMGGSPRLGTAVRDVSADEAREAGLEGIAGARVTGVEPESAAARAGLAEGDIIVKVDGQDVRGARHLTRVVAETPAGRPVAMEYVRAAQRAQVTVTLESTPRALAHGVRGAAPRDFAYRMREPRAMVMGRSRGRLGVGVQDLTPQLAQYFGVKAGVLVTQVNDGSAAGRAGMKAGDVITRVDSTDVTRASDIARALAPVDGGATVSVELTRDRASQSLTVTLDARPTRAPVVVRPRIRTAAE